MVDGSLVWLRNLFLYLKKSALHTEHVAGYMVQNTDKHFMVIHYEWDAWYQKTCNLKGWSRMLLVWTKSAVDILLISTDLIFKSMYNSTKHNPPVLKPPSIKSWFCQPTLNSTHCPKNMFITINICLVLVKLEAVYPTNLC